MDNFTKYHLERIEILKSIIKSLKEENQKLKTQQGEKLTPKQKASALYNCFEDLRDACQDISFVSKSTEELKEETCKNIDYYLSAEYQKNIS